MSAHPLPPDLALAMTEVPRAGRELVQLLFRFNGILRRHARGDGRPVLVLPGYGAADGSTAVLRYCIRRLGYDPRALSLGRNLETVEERIRSVDDAIRFRDRMTGAVAERVEQIHAETGEPVTLVGWSMGGLYAIDASRVAPDKIRQVITLGTPFGDPRGSTMFKLMRRLSNSKVPVEAQDYAGWLARAESRAPTQVIYSARDGIVATDIARLRSSHRVQYREVDSSHMGFAINPDALDAVAQCLAEAVEREAA